MAVNRGPVAISKQLRWRRRLEAPGKALIRWCCVLSHVARHATVRAGRMVVAEPVNGYRNYL
jgi:hypothetical protein